MNVLVACEYSGVVRSAFEKRGHFAVSVDLLKSEDNGFHYQGDIMRFLSVHDKWGLIIAHPPCTALCVSGNRWYGSTAPKHQERIDAKAWTLALWERCLEVSPRVCFENPVGVLGNVIGKPAQYIQPYGFGHPETKRTGLWLHNLPKLMETNNVKAQMDQLPEKEKHRIHHMSPGPDRGKERARFFQGWAEAMADQWGSL